MNASAPRSTRFELHTLVQLANHFRVSASQRGGAVEPNGVVGPNGTQGLRPVAVPTLEIPEEAFSDEEMETIHEALRILEEKFALVYDGWAAAPERMHEAVSTAVEAEARAKRAELKALELEARQAEKLAELTALDEEIAAKRAK